MVEMVYLDGRMDALVQKYACDDNLEWRPEQVVQVPKDLLTLLTSPLIKLTILPILAPATALPPESKGLSLMPQATSNVIETCHALLFFLFPFQPALKPHSQY